jgi:hypothetical protein
MRYRMAGLALLIGTVACGGDEPTKPIEGDLIGTWSGTLSTDVTTAPRTGTLHVFVQDATHANANVQLAGGAAFALTAYLVDVEPSFFDIVLSAGPLGEVHCALTSANACAGYADVKPSESSAVIRYSVQLTRVPPCA